MSMKIAVIVTCFNRKEKTLKSLLCLAQALRGYDIQYDIHLTDDGCTDGTVDGVLSFFPNAFIYKGGNLFWAGGTRLAWAGAISKGGYDYYLLLNDDTYVNNLLIPDLLECDKISEGNAIIRGNICDPDQTHSSYPLFRIKNWFSYRLESVIATGKPELVDLCGANIFWVPSRIVSSIGVFPNIYVHGIADFDYCLRAKNGGFKILGTSHNCGTCVLDHSPLSSSVLKKMTLADRWRYINSPKGHELKQQLYYQWSFFPWRVPFVFIREMLRVLLGV